MSRDNILAHTSIVAQTLKKNAGYYDAVFSELAKKYSQGEIT